MKKCPICNNPLENVNKNNEYLDYWMCFRCIKGYNNEELKEKEHGKIKIELNKQRAKELVERFIKRLYPDLTIEWHEEKEQ